MGAVSYVNDRVVVDRTGIELAVLFSIVLAISAAIGLEIGPSAATSPPSEFGSGTSAKASAGAAWAIAEVAVAAGLLLLLFVYKRLPEWLQKLASWNVFIVMGMYLGNSLDPGNFWAGTGFVLLVFSVYFTLNHFDIWWVANNVLSVALAVVGGIVIGLMFGVPGMILAFVVLTVYDHLFANKQTWMFSIGSAILSMRLPVLFVRPTKWRLSWDSLVKSMGADREDAEDESNGDAETPGMNGSDSWGLGTADLMLPAGFVVAVATSDISWLPTGGPGITILVAAGIVAACFRLRHEMLSRGSGAGLPALAAGALVPYLGIAAVAALV